MKCVADRNHIAVHCSCNDLLLLSRPQLLENTIFKGIEVLGQSLLSRNFSYAYILRENPAKNYLKIIDFNAKPGDSGRIMNERLCKFEHFLI